MTASPTTPPASTGPAARRHGPPHPVPAPPHPVPAQARPAGTRGARAAACTQAVTPSAPPDLRSFAVETARRWRIPQDALDAVSVVVTELVGNVVVHSGSAEVTVLLTQRAGHLTVEVKDLGRWRCRPEPPRSTEAAVPAGGRGLKLVRQAAGCWLAVMTPTGTRVTVRVPVAATPGRPGSADAGGP
ncbi:ATP-binding protein [Kitasatospora camelliae]|uniref:ATP-binding protein n=1 Tax=Kitasatospora camelliae TaxID=3156397 RepID=A0AAU8K5L2_9ACTN